MTETYLIVLFVIGFIGLLTFISSIPKKYIVKSLEEYINDDSSALVEVNKLGIKELLRYSSITEILSFFTIYSYSIFHNNKRYIYRKAEIETQQKESNLVYLKIRVKFRAIKEIEIIDSYKL